MLGGNRSESWIIILYGVSEQGYLVLALYKHALLRCYIMLLSVVSDEEDSRECSNCAQSNI